MTTAHQIIRNACSFRFEQKTGVLSQDQCQERCTMQQAGSGAAGRGMQTRRGILKLPTLGRSGVTSPTNVCPSDGSTHAVLDDDHALLADYPRASTLHVDDLHGQSPDLHRDQQQLVLRIQQQPLVRVVCNRHGEVYNVCSAQQCSIQHVKYKRQGGEGSGTTQRGQSRL